MEENEIKKASFLAHHFEAIKQIPNSEEQAAAYEAIFAYMFYGLKRENLPPVAKALLIAIMPELEEQRKENTAQPAFIEQYSNKQSASRPLAWEGSQVLCIS